MEWPIVSVPDEDELVSSDPAQAVVDDDDFDTSASSGTSTIKTMMITQEIYARAALGCVSDITVDHRATGLQEKVDTFLGNLQQATSIDNRTNWVTYEYRTLSSEFTELMAFASTIGGGESSHLLEICQGGLDAVHDLMKYRVPTTTNSSSADSTVLAARDAYVLCQSLSPKLTTERLLGTRPPDLDYKFDLLLEDNINNHDYDTNSVYAIQACNYVTQLRKQGLLEISASSLAKYTFTSRNNVVATRLSNKAFVVLGCDHPMAPTKSLLQIPGVTVYGIPTSWKGLDDILEYVRFQSPDNTTFIYPTNGGENNDGSSGNSTRNDGNYILSHGPHIAQWILDNTARSGSNDHDEYVIVPMTASNSHTESAVRYAASSDLIIQRVLQTHRNSHTHSSSNKKKKFSLWMYQSSQTCMIVPPASTTKSQELLQQRPSYESWIHTLSMNTVLTPTYSNVDDEEDTAATTTTNDVENNINRANQNNNQNHDYAIVNGIIATPGGAHHVLVETIRMWRCLITNLSPNDDYDHNDDIDDDYDDYDTKRNSNNDVHVFAPYIPLWKTTNDSYGNGNGSGNDELVMESNHLQIFESGTAAALMTSIGLAGILDPIVNRPMPTIEHGYETTPFSLFWEGSVHGGVWNCPYTLNSVSGISGYVLGKVYNYYDTYYIATAEAGGAVESSVVNTATTITPSGTNNGDVNNNKDSSDSSSSSPSSSIVHAVPSTLGEPMPDLVRERLEILA